MKIHEFQAKKIFSRYGIPVPKGIVATSVEEARQATESMGGRAVLKAQIHAGGRGKSGGVQAVRSGDEAEDATRKMLQTNLVTNQTGPQGAPVHQVLVEELADISQELYFALTVDREGHDYLKTMCEGLGYEVVDEIESLPARLLSLYRQLTI